MSDIEEAFNDIPPTPLDEDPVPLFSSHTPVADAFGQPSHVNGISNPDGSTVAISSLLADEDDSAKASINSDGDDLFGDFAEDGRVEAQEKHSFEELGDLANDDDELKEYISYPAYRTRLTYHVGRIMRMRVWIWLKRISWMPRYPRYICLPWKIAVTCNIYKCPTS